MSHEYSLVLADENVCQHVIDTIKSSVFCVEHYEGSVYLKDRSIKNGAPYEVRVIQEDRHSLWLQVNLRSPVFYDLLKAALGAESYRCLEDGDLDNEVSLHDALGLKVARVKSD